MFHNLPLNKQHRLQYILLALLTITYIQQCNSIHPQYKPIRMLQTQIQIPAITSTVNDNRGISTNPISSSSLSNYYSNYIMPGVQPWQHKLTQLLANAYLGRQAINNNQINSNLYTNSNNGANLIINNNLLPYNPSINPLNTVYPTTFAPFPTTYVNPYPFLTNIYSPTVISPQLISNTIPNTNQNFQNNVVPTNTLTTTTNAELENQKVLLMGQSINQRITSQLLNSLMRQKNSGSSQQIQQPSIQTRNISVRITFINEKNTAINNSLTPDLKPSSNSDNSSIQNVEKNNKTNNSSTSSIVNTIIPTNSHTEVKVKAEVEKVNLNLRNTQTNSKTKPTFLSEITLSYREYIQVFPQKRIKNVEEESLRKKIYEQNIKNINSFNKNTQKTYRMGYNLFTDYEEKQFQKLFLKLIVPPQFVKRVSVAGISQQKYEKPENISINWSCKSGVVHNLTKCAVSYIFAPLDSIQITASIHQQIINPLSVQQFISCVKDKYLNGCSSGFYDKVFLEASSQGIVVDSNYYYDSQLNSYGMTPYCDQNRLKKAKRKVTIQQSNIIEPGNCKQIVFQLQYRSLAVAIWARKFQFYKQGKFSPEQINPNANLGLTLVGYHPQKGYLVKNSWGLQWGIQGHAYISEQTGICNYASYAVLQGEDPSSYQQNQSNEKLPLAELCDESQII